MPLAASNKCVYCFHTLKPEDVCFESIVNTTEPTPDDEKFSYRKKVKPDADPNDIEAKTRKPIMRFSRAEQDKFVMDPESGYPMHWRQSIEGSEFTLTNDRRICRFCHMPLPVRFGRCPNIMIGFCGNSGAGKTVYMLSLLHDLARVDGMSVTWDGSILSDQEANGGSVNYREWYAMMYTGNKDGQFQLPDATKPTDVLPPIVLNCMYKRTEFILTAYDMAGEGMRDASYMARMTEFLTHADGVVYLKDPEYLPVFENYNGRLNEHAHLETVFNRISAGTAGRGGRGAHIAITMTKIDMLYERCRDNPEFMKIVGNMFDRRDVTMYSGGYDAAATMSNNSRMKKLYGWRDTADDEILNVYNRQLTDESRRRRGKRSFWQRLFGIENEQPDDSRQCVMLFGVSPLGIGAQPYKKEIAPDVYIDVMDTQPNGMHNADPVLWILYCNGVFPEKDADHPRR